MELTLGQRKAVTKAIATRYRRADKAGKSRILDELCTTTGWHRNHARKALGQAGKPRIVKPRARRPPRVRPGCHCGPRALLGSAGYASAEAFGTVPSRVGRHIASIRPSWTSPTNARRCWSACRRRPRPAAAPERKKHQRKGRSLTKPGSLLKSQIPIRTWAQWDDAAPGFVEIDLVGHEGGDAVGEHAYTLTVTDIATGWTENRSVRNKARKWVLAALDDIAESMPFPL